MFRNSQAQRASQLQEAGPWTSNHLNMMGLPKGVSTVPAVLKINTGFTIGAGASTSVGTMILNPREEMIYNGD